MILILMTIEREKERERKQTDRRRDCGRVPVIAVDRDVVMAAKRFASGAFQYAESRSTSEK